MKPFQYALLVLLITIMIAGCSPPRLDAPGERGSLKPLFRGDAAMVLAWHPSARIVAAANGGIELFDLNSSQKMHLASLGGEVVSWLTDGSGLVVAQRSGERTTVRVMPLDGTPGPETVVDGRVISLMPTARGDILIGILSVAQYRFGVNVASRLGVWNRTTEPVIISLDENTIHPRVWQEHGQTVEEHSFFVLSPWQDEVFFSAFHDPPAFPPNFRLAIVNVASGVVRSIAKVSPSLSGGTYVRNGDAVMFGSHEVIKTVDEWDGSEIAGYPFRGSCFSASFDGRCLAVDGRLFLDGEKPADYAPDGRVFFSPQGREAIVAKDGWAYLLSGLQNDLKAELPDLDREEIVRLRKWRALGMITQQDYLDYRTKVVRND